MGRFFSLVFLLTAFGAATAPLRAEAGRPRRIAASAIPGFAEAAPAESTGTTFRLKSIRHNIRPLHSAPEKSEIRRLVLAPHAPVESIVKSQPAEVRKVATPAAPSALRALVTAKPMLVKAEKTATAESAAAPATAPVAQEVSVGPFSFSFGKKRAVAATPQSKAWPIIDPSGQK